MTLLLAKKHECLHYLTIRGGVFNKGTFLARLKIMFKL